MTWRDSTDTVTHQCSQALCPRRLHVEALPRQILTVLGRNGGVSGIVGVEFESLILVDPPLQLTTESPCRRFDSVVKLFGPVEGVVSIDVKGTWLPNELPTARA